MIRAACGAGRYAQRSRTTRLRAGATSRLEANVPTTASSAPFARRLMRRGRTRRVRPGLTAGSRCRVIVQRVAEESRCQVRGTMARAPHRPSPSASARASIQNGDKRRAPQRRCSRRRVAGPSWPVARRGRSDVVSAHETDSSSADWLPLAPALVSRRRSHPCSSSAFCRTGWRPSSRRRCSPPH